MARTIEEAVIEDDFLVKLVVALKKRGVKIGSDSDAKLTAEWSLVRRGYDLRLHIGTEQHTIGFIPAMQVNFVTSSMAEQFAEEFVGRFQSEAFLVDTPSFLEEKDGGLDA